MKRAMLMALLCLAAHAADANAGNRAVRCDGCSSSAMSRSAANATEEGTVYVFDAGRGSVQKYDVYTELVDTQPYFFWKEAVELTVESGIADAYRQYSQSVRDIANQGTLELPEDFPVRSVAGALLDPAFSTTSIEDHLRRLGYFDRVELHASTLLARLVRKGIKVLDGEALVDRIIINVEFPDGSTQDYSFEYAINAVTLDVQVDVVPKGNARVSTGHPAPSSRLSFDGFGFADHDGSLREWVAWARYHGVPVSGSGGTTMSCKVEGLEIRCVVRHQSY